MERSEIVLGQGWSRGLRLIFDGLQGSPQWSMDDVLHVKQVHGKRIYEVGPSDLTRQGPLAEADGLMVRGDWFKTSKKPLCIKTADCAPLIYVQHQSETLVLVHAGWRGLQQGIHRVPFEKGWLDPKETWIWLGPCLNGESFEVGSDVWSAFPKERQRAEIFAPVPGQPDKRYFHTWKYLAEEFRSLGVHLFYNVETDTFTDPEFASYRRMKRDGIDTTKHRNLTLAGFIPSPT